MKIWHEQHKRQQRNFFSTKQQMSKRKPPATPSFKEKQRNKNANDTHTEIISFPTWAPIVQQWQAVVTWCHWRGLWRIWNMSKSFWDLSLKFYPFMLLRFPRSSYTLNAFLFTVTSSLQGQSPLYDFHMDDSQNTSRIYINSTTSLNSFTQ